MFSKFFANTTTKIEPQLTLDPDLIAEVNEDMCPVYLDSVIDLPTNPVPGRKYIVLNGDDTYIGAEDSNYVRVTPKGKEVNMLVDQSTFLVSSGSLEVQLRNAVNAFLCDWETIKNNANLSIDKFITKADELRYGGVVRAFVITEHPLLHNLLSKCKNNPSLIKTLNAMGHEAWVVKPTEDDKRHRLTFKIGNVPSFHA